MASLSPAASVKNRPPFSHSGLRDRLPLTARRLGLGGGQNIAIAEPFMPEQKTSFTDAEALEFHRAPTPGKISITPTKPMATQRDLSLAYSPVVAAPVKAIAEDPDKAYDYTPKGNRVAVITNGTAILGLGNLGAMAAKPVMEGKSV